MKKLIVPSVFVGLLTLLALSSTLLNTSLSAWLEDMTGETDLKQQVVAVSSEISQRRLDTQDMAPLSHTHVNPYGVNVFLEQEVEDWKLRLTMEMIRDSGARWIRLHVPWADVEEPSKGEYLNSAGRSSWDKYDRIVELAGEYGINILARLDDPPNWSRQDNSVHNSPPDNYNDFGDFVYAFASRYRGRITYYQIWNEPNVYPEWGNRPVDAESYVNLLRIAYTQAKEADPSSVIVAAPLSPTLGTPDGMNESDLSFFQRMYDAGATDYFDVMAVNAYGLWTGPGDRRAEAARTNFSRPLLVREIMVRNGDAGKSIWASEMGWNALPDDFPGPPTHGRVSLERQATYTADAYRRAQEEWPWMGVIFYWQFRMVREEPEQVAYYYSMVLPDFTTQPVFDAFRVVAHEPPVLNFGYRQSNHWALDYQGSWVDAPGDVAGMDFFTQAAEAGASLSFAFRGTGLRLLVPDWLAAGRAYVSIDGFPPGGLPKDQEGRAYLDLASAALRPGQPLALAGALPSGVHEARIVAGAPGFALKALIVERDERDWWRISGGVALMLACMVTLVWVYSRR